MVYSFRLAARVLLYAPSHRQNRTYHSLCYTSRGAMAGTRNSSMVPPRRINQTSSVDHSYVSYFYLSQPVPYSWYIRGSGICCPVIVRVHVKDPLLLREMASDHSDSESKLVAVHRLFFPISSKGSFICTIP